MPMIRDADRFSQISSGIQSGVVSLAVIVGGIWTLYSFNAQLQVENARAQLTKLKREIDSESKIEISLETKQLRGKGREKLIFGTLMLKNSGTENTALVVADTPIQIFSVSFDQDGVEQWKLVRLLPMRQSDKTIYGAIALHAGSQVSRSFITPAPATGVYAVKFSASRSATEIGRLKAMGAPETDLANRAEWGFHTYLSVD